MFGRVLVSFIVAAGFVGVFAEPATAQGKRLPGAVQEPNDAAIRAGHDYASRICASCHDINSRIDDAAARARPPSFSAIANAKTTTPIGLNAFLTTTHAPMPDLIIAPEDRRNVIEYIMSLRRKTPQSI